MDAEDHASLLDKYEEMRALRLAGASAGPDVRPRLRALAARFPGALRELDRLPMPVLEGRIEALRRGARPPWAATLLSFHGWMRVALRVKARFGRDTPPEEVRRWLRETHRPRGGEPRLEELDAAAIRAFLRPPGGRLGPWVLARIARDRGTTPERIASEAFAGRSA